MFVLVGKSFILRTENGIDVEYIGQFEKGMD
jgi:hypothetical protein